VIAFFHVWCFFFAWIDWVQRLGVLTRLNDLTD
jgi:hypothetical protein